uniref:something about silencing protein 10-like n=1 Tax=Styela clava TaxID=7725 RepID=UPI00193A2A51|nr:something about silencing protein 10-like [Styela clava]
MAKKKRGGKGPATKPSIKEKDENLDGVKQDEEDFYYDEIDKFHANRDKLLLEDDGSDDDSKYSDEEEVLGIESDDDDDIDEEDESDDVEIGNKGITSESAWGKRKSSFYGADTYDGLEGSDREEAEKAEEEEVLSIQKRLAEQMDEDDFGLDILNVPETKTEEQSDEVLKAHVDADFSSLSKKSQWKLVKKESPELDGLIHDFKTKLSELQNEVSPLMKLVKNGTIPKGLGSDYISLKYRVYSAYLLNISFYLALKTNKTQVQNHPIVSRLVQYRTVINQLSPIEKKLRPEIDELLEENLNNNLEEDSLKNGEKLASSSEESDFEKIDEVVEFKKQRKRKSNPKENTDECDVQEFSKSMLEKLAESNDSDERIADNDDDETNGRRAINYEIAKNKGLRQKRRKIDRNPRVKMRQKYRKAKIRRRGQVREYRPEIKKYSGEASGIRIGLRKSTTLQ